MKTVYSILIFFLAVDTYVSFANLPSCRAINLGQNISWGFMGFLPGFSTRSLPLNPYFCKDLHHITRTIDSILAIYLAKVNLGKNLQGLESLPRSALPTCAARIKK